MEEISAASQMAKIRNFEKGFIATHLIDIGEKLKLFETLCKVEEGMTISELASKLGLHEPYLKIWCQTAYHLEILDCDQLGRFRLQPFLDEILGDKSHFRSYLANISLSVNFLGKFLEEYPEYFKSGRIFENPYTPEVSKAVFEVTKNFPLVFLSMILPRNDALKQMLERGIRFLDIGCGRGNLIIQLAHVFRKSIFVGIDPDVHGIEEAKTKISQLGLVERITVQNLAGEDSPYHEEFDMVSMAVTLHEINPNVRGKVVERAYRALKPNGQLLILDFPFPSRLEDFRNPMYEFGILDQFFEVCAGFVHLNVQEQNEMLQKVGFKNVQRMTIGKGMFEFVTAAK